MVGNRKNIIDKAFIIRYKEIVVLSKVFLLYSKYTFKDKTLQKITMFLIEKFAFDIILEI